MEKIDGMDFPPRPKNGLSLCGGGGGLDMGLQLAEPEFHTRVWVEIEPYPQQTIIAAQKAGYFAPADIWDDVTTFDGRPFRGIIDTVLAGYPCQPFSQAGQRKGKDDPRHLWPDIKRIIEEVRPAWVILENVAGHVTLGAEAVLRDLRGMGFTSAVGLFTAAETGATHERKRWFCMAYADGWNASAEREQCGGKQRLLQKGRGTGGGDYGSSGKTVANTSGRRSCGQSEGQDQQPRGTETVGSISELVNAAGVGCDEGRSGECGKQDSKRKADTVVPLSPTDRQIHPPGPSDANAWASIISMAPNLAPAISFGDCKRFADHLAQMVASGELAQEEAERRLRRMVDELSNRSRILKLLGNAVDPLQAALAIRTISTAHGLEPIS